MYVLMFCLFFFSEVVQCCCVESLGSKGLWYSFAFGFVDEHITRVETRVEGSVWRTGCWRAWPRRSSPPHGAFESVVDDSLGHKGIVTSEFPQLTFPWLPQALMEELPARWADCLSWGSNRGPWIHIQTWLPLHPRNLGHYYSRLVALHHEGTAWLKDNWLNSEWYVALLSSSARPCSLSWFIDKSVLANLRNFPLASHCGAKSLCPLISLSYNDLIWLSKKSLAVSVVQTRHV